MPKEPIYVRIEPDLKQWLESQAEKSRRKLSDYVRLVLEDHRKKDNMNIREYADKWNRDPNNNFAAACHNDNSMAELEFALENGPDETDMKNWGISSPDEWVDAVNAALFELRGGDE